MWPNSATAKAMAVLSMRGCQLALFVVHLPASAIRPKRAMEWLRLARWMPRLLWVVRAERVQAVATWRSRATA